MKKHAFLFFLVVMMLSGCTINSAPFQETGEATGKIPDFEHVIIIWLENRSYKQVIGNEQMPFLNQAAKENVLLSQYYAVTHPSLPNYLALIGGDTFGITSDCTDCFIHETSLPDLLEEQGKTWKTYQEGLPSPCFLGSQGKYRQKHNPFIYFDSIRNNPDRCNQSIVSLEQLDADLSDGKLPNFAFIMPDMCNSGHDCDLSVSDSWVENVVTRLLSSPALGDRYMLVISFDESSGDRSSCCGMSWRAGGRIPAVIISPLAKPGFEDTTPYSHYSLLKTILTAWSLPNLGFTANDQTKQIAAPWK